MKFAPAILALALLGACAGPKALPSPTLGLPTATILAGKVSYLDQFRLELPFVLCIQNPLPRALTVDSLEARLGSGELGLSTVEIEGKAQVIAAGSGADIPFSILVDLRKADLSLATRDRSRLDWKLDARLKLRTREGETLNLSLPAQGSLALIQEPLFRISSIVIDQDILVKTAMRLVLEIENPNDFPLRLTDFSYKLYGEGKTWALGNNQDGLDIQALASVSRDLGFEMNFADMDRRLFDLVAKQRLVNYRLTGEARLETGLEGLPYFVARFDREGKSEVRK